MVDTEDAYRETLALLTRRAAGTTICPSEGQGHWLPMPEPNRLIDWRDAVPVVHAAIDRLVAEGAVQLSWKGEVLKARVGPYRICRTMKPADGCPSAL